MLESDSRRRLKAGLFTAALLGLLAASILVIGKKQGMFTRNIRYQTQFHDVAGLVPGSQVWLNGVVVGAVEAVDLPEDPAQPTITVSFRIRRVLADRIRADSRVRIRTLGLLGDRYLELSSGSPLQPLLPEESTIPSVEPTDIAEALSQGGQAMGNIVAITGSLRRILEKMEQGQGILGALINQPVNGAHFNEQITRILTELGEITSQVKKGQGFLGKLITDPEGEKLFFHLQESAAAAYGITASLERDLSRDDTALAILFRDPSAGQHLQATLTNLAQATQALAAASQELASGHGTLPRLLRDKQLADTFLEDMQRLTHALASTAEKLDQGQGSAGQFMNDPQLYQDLENVVRGVQKSALLRWFVRNRRQAGEKATANPAQGGK